MKRLFTVAAALVFASVAGATSIYTAGPGLALAIPDNGYNGTQGSMLCNVITVASEPGMNTIAGPVTLSIAITHTWVGDLVIKLFAPTGSYTLVSRPGLVETIDDGSECCGDSSNLLIANPLSYAMSAVPESETMGSTITSSQTVCLDDTICAFNPNKGITAQSDDLALLIGTDKVGTWTLCIGDGGGGDTGTLDGWTLDLGTVTPVELTSVRVD